MDEKGSQSCEDMGKRVFSSERTESVNVPRWAYTGHIGETGGSGVSGMLSEGERGRPSLER